MFKVALISEYDGTDFVGFQIQDNGRSVQAELQKALTELYKTDIAITGCSRTDSGVHARGHVSSADVPFYIPEDKIPLAINPLLPNDLAIKKAVYVKEDFNARFNNNGKRYIYRIHQGKTRSPLMSRYSYHTNYPIDIAAMNEGAKAFAGEHDFAAFCAAGGSQITTVRRIREVNVRQSGDIIEIEVNGEAFLYNMVRIIAGTLLYVGTGKFKPEDVAGIIASCDRKKAGNTLPPEGLTLEEVFYDWDFWKA